MPEQEYSHLFKVLIVGSTGVGKTCLLIRYTDKIYKEKYGSTIGVDFKMKTIELEGEKIKLQLWDTAGQERFRTITSSYYRNANGIILVFDLTDRDTFADLKGWIGEISNNITESVVIFILGNKTDEVKGPAPSVTDEEVEELINSYSNTKLLIRGYRKVSAKTGDGVSQSFEDAAKEIKKERPKATQQKQKGVQLETDEGVTRRCCIG